MKNILIIMAVISSLNSLACICDVDSPILEFYASEYVFEGEVVSKVYAKDSLTYTVTFDCITHYKSGDAPERMDFELTAEAEYVGTWTSCDWHADIGQKWLVYADDYKGKFYFDYMCSNSRIVNRYPIERHVQKVLHKGNQFNIRDYVYEYQHSFNRCVNITNIDSILARGKRKHYRKPITLLSLSIDTTGTLIKVDRVKGLVRNKDSVFGLTTSVKYTNNEPVTEFESEVIPLIGRVKAWDVKQHNSTKIKVPYIRHIWVEYDYEKDEWSYDL